MHTKKSSSSKFYNSKRKLSCTNFPHNLKIELHFVQLIDIFERTRMNVKCMTRLREKKKRNKTSVFMRSVYLLFNIICEDMVYFSIGFASEYQYESEQMSSTNCV